MYLFSAWNGRPVRFGYENSGICPTERGNVTGSFPPGFESPNSVSRSRGQPLFLGTTLRGSRANSLLPNLSSGTTVDQNDCVRFAGRVDRLDQIELFARQIDIAARRSLPLIAPDSPTTRMVKSESFAASTALANPESVSHFRSQPGS
ncbi:MAG: hypothetical protein IPP63_19340 [Chloracidobacterium sp.]|nr:hypothetical protein [Chloracidobacterium sp.]